jgi:hypothetical protein
LFRGENPGISKEQNNKETEVKCDPSGKEKTKKKRRSFDGNETATGRICSSSIFLVHFSTMCTPPKSNSKYFFKMQMRRRNGQTDTKE